eukprot:NODE_2921_length_446_cov_103.589421_g2317_i0.p4 GENE.NODE_2921_length_446_cov_103.589421_g2317_i0~~NODE_2921_length_446_cov_103.589421_g2317_i0.p4  ORF type:complete len:56 (-),score=11.00 NODE_2921_length_446_cov_103.589421_g2317_i0:209-376(-)
MCTLERKRVGQAACGWDRAAAEGAVGGRVCAAAAQLSASTGRGVCVCVCVLILWA